MEMYFGPSISVNPNFRYKVVLNKLPVDAINWLRTHPPINYQDRYCINWRDPESKVLIWFECETSAILFKLKYGDS